MNEVKATGAKRFKMKKILVVDDNLGVRNTLKRLLEKNYKIITANDGKEAVAIVQTNKINLILMDIMMPVMDGIVATRLIRESYKHSDLPIIALSAVESKEKWVEALKAGANDFVPKPFHQAELLARIGTHLQVASLSAELAQKNERFMQELEQAKVTQSTIFPKKLPNIPGGQLAVQYVPCEKVGGDLYDISFPSEDCIGLLVADVTGHGISAALISFMVFSLFKTSCGNIKNPSLTLELMNNFLYDKIEAGKFVSAWYGTYDMNTKNLIYCSAGHPPAYLIRKTTHEVIPLSTSGGLLGPFNKNMINLQTESIQLVPGDKIFVYTDGITESTNVAKEMFGHDRLEHLLLSQDQSSLQAWLNSIYSTVLNYSQASFFDDDVTLLALELPT